MAPMRSTDMPATQTDKLAEPCYSAAERDLLLDLARDAIAQGLRHGRPPGVTSGDYPDHLQEPGASFVTLHRHGELRGCIGSLEAHRPLIEDIAHNAYAAAFRDPRFAPLSAAEFADLDIHISVLGPAQTMQFRSEADLLGQLRPGVDGLILESAGDRGTFLPSVWDQLPEAGDFLHHLKRKAGIAVDAWPKDIRVWRYVTESFPE